MLRHLRKLHPLWVAQRIASFRDIHAARKAGANDPIPVRLYGIDLTLRPVGPDFKVAITSLGLEFNPLAKTLPRNFDGLIVDGGGFVGTAAIRLSQLFPKASVVTIEPSDENFAILAKNIEGHDKITAIHAALVPAGQGDVTLFNRGTGPWGYTIIENPSDHPDATTLQSITTTTLSDIVAKSGHDSIGLIKLDIEGGEKALFDTDDQDLKRAKVIFVELHDRIVKGCSSAFRTFTVGRTITKPGREKYLAVRS